MATQKLISANLQKNNGGTVLGAGNVASTSKFSALTLINNNTEAAKKNTLPIVSTTLGNAKPITAGKFSTMEKGEYVGMVIGDRIASTDKTTLRSASADFNRGNLINSWYGYERLNISDWSYINGTATTGGAAGFTIVSSGIDNVTGAGADHTKPSMSRDGEIQYMYGGPTATQKDIAKSNG